MDQLAWVRTLHFDAPHLCVNFALERLAEGQQCVEWDLLNCRASVTTIYSP
jgi:hypothetical protein